MRATLRLARLLALPLVFGAAACDNPVEHDEHPDGLIVLDASGAEVARHDVSAQTTTGQLQVGLQGSTTFTVQAIAEDGDVIEIDGDELSIQLSGVRPGWTASVSGANQVVITPPEASVASLIITLFHGDHRELEATFQVVAQ